jgi:hypothetical protein
VEFALDVLLRQIRIDVHHVVWVDEIYGEIPGLAFRTERLALGALPAGDEGGCRVVVVVAAEGRIVDIADPEEILETMGFKDTPVIGERRIDGVVDLIEIHAQMPFALVGGVVAELSHAMPNRLYLGGHVGLPQ